DLGIRAGIPQDRAPRQEPDHLHRPPSPSHPTPLVPPLVGGKAVPTEGGGSRAPGRAASGAQDQSPALPSGPEEGKSAEATDRSIRSRQLSPRHHLRYQAGESRSR